MIREEVCSSLWVQSRCNTQNPKVAVLATDFVRHLLHPIIADLFFHFPVGFQSFCSVQDTPGITLVRPMETFGDDDCPKGHMEILFEDLTLQDSYHVLSLSTQNLLLSWLLLRLCLMT